MKLTYCKAWSLTRDLTTIAVINELLDLGTSISGSFGTVFPKILIFFGLIFFFMFLDFFDVLMSKIIYKK
jgi:hypothetical protein